ncbi:MAG: hypothetical protein U0M15_00260 [Bacillota bacterium]|nr:hypothetical protein [Bacillota bacterium]
MKRHIVLWLILSVVMVSFIGCGSEERDYSGFLELPGFTEWSSEVADIIQLREMSDEELRDKGYSDEEIKLYRETDLDADIQRLAQTPRAQLGATAEQHWPFVNIRMSSTAKMSATIFTMNCRN